MLSYAIWFVEFSLFGNYYQVSEAAVADPLSKYLLFGWPNFYYATITKSWKEAVATRSHLLYYKQNEYPCSVMIFALVTITKSLRQL